VDKFGKIVLQLELGLN